MTLLWQKKINNGGYLLVQVLVFGTIATVLLGGLVSWGVSNSKLIRTLAYREQALQLAEAGIDYYRWHLAHSPQDFQDGTATSGPYIHDYYDKDGNLLGTYALTIIPPLTGSTVVTITSRGQVASTTISRAIEAKFAIPSLAKFSIVANSAMRFGLGTEVFGPIHSNDGLRFDGLAHNLVTSAKDKYDDPDHVGDNEFGVHTHLNPPPPAGSLVTSFRSNEAPPTSPVPTRSDVFLAGRQFPVPTVDFGLLSTNLSQLKTSAQSAGHYFSSSGALGYNIVLKTSDTFDLYKVTAMEPTPRSNCKKENIDGQEGWGTLSIKSQILLGNYSFPANGIIFLEDNIWVEGQINTARLTIVSARFPENANTNTSITVNKDILYTNYDGQDVLSLIAQGNFNIGMISEDNLEIDGALVSKNGRVGRYFYNANCSPYNMRDTIKLYGMLATNQRYGFSYSDASGTRNNGYEIREIVYDGNLLYSPPPSFPLTSDQYQMISWREVK